MEKAVTRRKWTTGLLIAGTVVLVVAFWSLIMSMLSLLAVAGVLTLLSLPLCKVLELDEAEVRKSLEQTDGAQLDSLMQQLEEGAADDTGTEADHAV